LEVPAEINLADFYGVVPNVSPYISGINGGACYSCYTTKAEEDTPFFLEVWCEEHQLGRPSGLQSSVKQHRYW
jgi:hypothetical protein